MFAIVTHAVQRHFVPTHSVKGGGGGGQGLTPLRLILKTVDSIKFNFDKQSGLPLKGKTV